MVKQFQYIKYALFDFYWRSRVNKHKYTTIFEAIITARKIAQDISIFVVIYRINAITEN